jgi:hypothetical protein
MLGRPLSREDSGVNERMETTIPDNCRFPISWPFTFQPRLVCNNGP